MIKVYTDGAFTGSGIHTGLGGWGYIIVDDDGKAEFEHAGGEKNTTNNRMEMEAVIQSLKQIVETKHLYKSDSEIRYFSDSNIIVETLRKGGTWKRKANVDKWDEIDALVTLLVALGFDIDFEWVKAHDKTSTKQTSQYNKRADTLATKARDIMKELSSDEPVWL